MNKAKYVLYDAGDKYHHKLFKTVNLNPCGKKRQHDGIYHTLKVLRTDLSDKDILEVITNERIRRYEVPIDTPAIRRIIKDALPGYKAIKVGKELSLIQVIDSCLEGTIIIRMGTEVVTYDYDTGNIYTSEDELYTQRPVSEYWVEDKK